MKSGGYLKRRKPLARIGKHAAFAKAKGLRRSKSKTNYKKRLWDIFSKYIRLKAADENGMVTCVSCGAVGHWKKMHAGHYIAKSLGSAIYFEERNVAVQCVTCNLWRHGNLPAYALYLLKTYGASILDELDALRRTETQLREPWYLEQIEAYKRKLEPLLEKFKEAA